jgi:serralysin
MCVICRLAAQGEKPVMAIESWACDEALALTLNADLKAIANGSNGIPAPSFTETTDAAGSSATIYAMTAGQSYLGSLATNSDIDFYRVTLTAGQAYTFVLTGIGTNNLRDPLLQLHDTGGVSVITSNDDGLPGLNSVISYTPTSSGTYYLSARAFAGSDTGTYGISVTAGTRPDLDINFAAGIIDSDLAWNTTPGNAAVVTYSFRASAASYTAGGSNIATFTPLTAAQIAVYEELLALWSSVANITFQRVNPGGYSNDATMVIGNYTDATDGAGAFAYYPGSTAAADQAGDVWLNLNAISTTSLPRGSYSYMAIMHEIGHALGLSHPGLYNAGPGVSITYGQDAQFIQDSGMYSVMSYFFDGSDTGANFQGEFASTPQIVDIRAIQNIYGVNTTTRNGNTVYGVGTNAGASFDFVANTRPVLTIWDGGGTDTINVSNATVTQTIDLREGFFSNLYGLTNNVSIALGAVIENVVGGSGADTIIGNSAGNTLEGGGSGDTIVAGGGNDVITGGAGNDGIDGGTGTDAVLWLAARSNYFVRSFVSAGQTYTQVSAASGTDGADTLINVEVLGFNNGAQAFGLAGIQQNLVSNMDGSYFDDVLFQNSVTGQIIYQNMNAGTGSGFANVLGSLPTGWRLVGSDDFTGDGRADSLVQDTNTGAIYTLNIASGAPVWGLVAGPMGSSYRAIASGDVTRDGTADVLVRNNADGQIFIADMNAGGTFGSWILGPNLGTGWRTVGLGDFNRDGASDVLVQNIADGTTYYRDVANGQWGTVAGPAGAQWVAREAADLNGDGYTDVVFRNTSTSDIWWVNMLGGTNAGWNVVANGLAGWDIRGSADVDNDGHRDVIIQNLADGTTYYADMNAGTFAGWGTVSGAISTQWVAVA